MSRTLPGPTHCFLGGKLRVMSDKILVVAAVIVDDLLHPTKMLAARRKQPAQIAGRWEFPGGKAEPGETDQEALHREVSEELGVQVALGAQVRSAEVADWPITERHIMRLWFAQITAGEPQPLVEHDALQWVSPAEFAALDWLDGDVAIVEHLRSYFL